jgi:cell division septation protein DedD
MFQERRRFQRVGLDSPLLVFLDESKYSLLFDVCEEGLAVDGLAARGLSEVIPFAFDLPERSGCIQGRAEIVWTNESEHRTGLHFLDLADPSREQLIDWISARACTTRLVGTEKEPIQPTVVTHATRALINPIFQDSKDNSESRSVSSLFPRLLSEEFEPKNPEVKSAEELNSNRKLSHTIVVALASVLLSSVFGFLVYHSRGTRNNLQARDSTTAAKASEMPSEAATASVKPSSATTPFSPPPARLDLPGFMLQVGAMRHEANADALAQDLQEKNFPAFVFRRGTDRFYRVAVGPYSDEDSPVRVKDELEKHGLKAFLRRWVPE